MRYRFALGAVIFAALDARASTSILDVGQPTGRLSQSFVGYQQPLQDFADLESHLEAELAEEVRGASYGLKIAPWISVWTAGSQGGPNTQKSRSFFELKEAWVEHVSTAVDLRVGNQIFSWGTSDQVNPTDVWNPRDYYSLFDAAKLPVTALRLNVHPPASEHLSLEAIATPYFRPSVLPVEGSRWLMPLPTAVLLPGIGQVPLSYETGDASYPSTWQAGARLQLSRVGGWDFSASYYNGVENLPRFAFLERGSTADPALPITVTLSPSYHREQMLGADGSGALTFGDREVGTHFEVAYTMRDNSRVLAGAPEYQGDLYRRDSVQLVLGADYTFRSKVLGSILYLNLQYVDYREVGAQSATPGGFTIEGLPDLQPWDRDLVLYWENRFGYRLKLTGTVVASLQKGDGLIRPALQYSWSDNFKTVLAAQAFLGSPQGFYGQFRDNSSAGASATYSY